MDYLKRIRSELVFIKWVRIMCTTVAAINLCALSVNAFTGRMSSETVATCSLATLVGVFGLLSVEFGSPMLLALLRDGEPILDSGYLVVLLEAMRYRLARRVAMERLGTILPSLNEETIAHVERGLWKRVYSYVRRSPTAQAYLAFDIAAMLSDSDAVPYLTRVIERSDLPVDVREDFVRRMKALLEATSQEHRGYCA